ncbi:hypothetical protein GCM10022408_35980 [Hymenobacter fastidiosus]|uniref:DUF4382 domain-containing protein n=1 Tax=Hymenobacter fastidiosus TaxID=486264 RepID=A0ABP7SZN0_9BACT
MFFVGCQDALQDVTVQTQTAASDAKKKIETYQAVNIDLLRVEVSQADEENGNWTSLTDVSPGMRNLLQTGNASTPLFTSSQFQAGTLKQARLVLGPNSTILLSDGRLLALDTPSGQTSGLKVKVNAPVLGNQAQSVLVTIDPNWQVVARGNGTYGLKPVLQGTIATGNPSGGG